MVTYFTLIVSERESSRWAGPAEGWHQDLRIATAHSSARPSRSDAPFPRGARAARIESRRSLQHPLPRDPSPSTTCPRSSRTFLLKLLFSVFIQTVKYPILTLQITYFIQSSKSTARYWFYSLPNMSLDRLEICIGGSLLMLSWIIPIGLRQAFLLCIQIDWLKNSTRASLKYGAWYFNQSCSFQGDALVTTCWYDSTVRDNVTLGGFAITDEMCVNYVHYYPRMQLEVCKSSITTSALNDYFQFVNRLVQQT